jgi:ankyrin repeat protein
MVGTRSNSILERESPQYAYSLAILIGGIAFAVSQLRAPVVIWLLSYALLAALFASVWPYRALQWGGWLCLPIILLICFDVFVTGSTSGLLSNGKILVKALPAACLGAYLGSKLSIREITNGFTNKPAKRKELYGNGNGAHGGLVLKELTAFNASAQTNFSSHSSRDALQAIEPAAHFNALNTALMKAAQEGDLNRVKLLVADGADVNAERRDQWTPAMIAAGGGDGEMVERLFGEGLALAASSNKGWAALMIATIEGHTEVVRALLEHGAQVNAENNKGWTALRFAVSMDETEILHLLLEAGADVNLVDHEGKTALMQAAGENIKESLKALLDAGADPHLKDHNEQTALMIAHRQGHTKIIKLLKEAEAKTSTESSALINILDAGDSNVAGRTHRVIKIPRDQDYGLIDKYDVIPIRAALPSGCEETGREGNEEECRDYAWKSIIDEQPELGRWFGV